MKCKKTIICLPECKCCEGPPGPRGPRGPQGPSGEPGSITCNCCEESMKDLLTQINTSETVTLSKVVLTSSSEIANINTIKGFPKESLVEFANVTPSGQESNNILVSICKIVAVEVTINDDDTKPDINLLITENPNCPCCVDDLREYFNSLTVNTQIHQIDTNGNGGSYQITNDYFQAVGDGILYTSAQTSDVNGNFNQNTKITYTSLCEITSIKPNEPENP
ncbi:hypothetical protein [Haloimpatiens massiliensis]|uniref:hypothetical protein n=1 Tax=Haloimpatiens massiliensis TaxID=1658110 RepID=UPI000C815CE0|nr:hypothetical protein [Haloimpatiens massiliensis]